jgi:crotonobetainyl-CoA:carnitine CoA-transferase CaiB-like acyl-CoA transferase
LETNKLNKKYPLSGIKVIEVCNVAAGPFCGLLLADMGADVIKVENPNGGDSLRAWPPLSEGYSENFASLNRNKRSITLDLKQSADLERLRALICESDVLIENNRPGVMDRLGVGYQDAKGLNPTIVYCSISAYGQSGPRAHEGGFDLTLQAMSGVMSVTGEADGAPVKCGVPIADFTSGLYGAYAIVSALRSVELNGVGEHLDISMLGATLGVSALQTSEYFGTGRDPVKLGSAHPRNAPYQAFRCRDGYFALAAGNNSLWKSVCEVIGRPDVFEDARFLTTTDRAKNQVEMRTMLEAIFSAEDAAVWLSRFRSAGVPCAELNTYSKALADEQVTAMGWVQDLELPNGVTTKTFISPIVMSGERFPIFRAPPLLGEHNEEVFKKLGYPRS